MFTNTIMLLAIEAMAMVNVEGYNCETSLKSGTNNHGPGVSDGTVDDSTPFATGAYNAIVAFDETHCVEMCCEQQECYVAVFDEDEAVCYLKAVGALGGANDVAAENVSSYTIERRIGEYKGVNLTPRECNNKRGVGYGFKDVTLLNSLKNGLSWWYDWSPGFIEDDILEASFAQGSYYVPMIWGKGDLEEGRLLHISRVAESSSYLLGFNEPNYGHQAKLTAQEAAQLWSQVRLLAEDDDMDLVSPAVNYCSGECIEPDPIQWLDDFFEECGNILGGCGVKYLAVHSYACEVRYLNKHMHMYTKYGLPIWLTEFSCAFESTAASEASQAEYLSEAITYLELNPHIFRYAWFTVVSSKTDGVENSDLLDLSTGELTAVGEVFVSEYANLQHCKDKATGISSIKPILPADNETWTSMGTEAEPGNGLSSSKVKPTRKPEPKGAPLSSSTTIDDGHYTTSNVPEVSVGEPSDGLELDVDPTAEVIKNAVITNIGGSGYFDTVVEMVDDEDISCPSLEDTCVKEQVCVSGELAPFDEVSVVFRGPMNLYNIAWYEGTADGTLERTSKWTPGSKGDNIVFMKNLGGVNGCAGEWSICGGNSQSYADASGILCSPVPTAFSGNLPNDNEVNIMTAWECASNAQCSFYRDVGMRGWQGGGDGTKVLIFEVDMPHCEENACAWNRPAVWALNAMVLRTAQYGCNCRGMGGNGGCGEFDMLEAVVGNPHSDMLFTQVYDFKGSGGPGSSKFFKRPSGKTTYAAVFRGGWDSYLQIVELDDWNFGSATLMKKTLDELKGSTSYEIYDVDSRAAPAGCLNEPDNVKVELFEAEGYEFVGCFADMQPMSARDMDSSTDISFNRNEASMCANRCAKVEEATFFGLQDGVQCWCGGMGGTGPGTYGKADNCDTPCPGNESVACGGKLASSVYVIHVDHNYVGCYTDVKGDRDMLLVPKMVSDYLTPAVCAAYCSSVDGAVFFGVQARRKCFCGDSFGRHGESLACDEPCKGDSNQVCGAHNVNSVYTLQQLNASMTWQEGDMLRNGGD